MLTGVILASMAFMANGLQCNLTDQDDSTLHQTRTRTTPDDWGGFEKVAPGEDCWLSFRGMKLQLRLQALKNYMGDGVKPKATMQVGNFALLAALDQHCKGWQNEGYVCAKKNEDGPTGKRDFGCDDHHCCVKDPTFKELPKPDPDKKRCCTVGAKGMVCEHTNKELCEKHGETVGSHCCAQYNEETSADTTVDVSPHTTSESTTGDGAPAVDDASQAADDPPLSHQDPKQS
jgi:hypothetical protein